MHTTRSTTKQEVPLIPLDLELKRAVQKRMRHHRNRMNGEKKERNQPLAQNGQNGQRTIRDYVSSNVKGDQNLIVRPVVTINNFEIKPAMIQMIQNS